eukprot:gnl/TRDRNA2_/TRDRNA2_188102_c0_seq1.p1 gnl/TRDRNA2_/TRDRNA2_188102_c0~~gnl/TRDRNA2_/TRDRNA2_188102_c0_seq1.p1  ORF type:complete len:525 (-),score=78.27 gnl/TRDRNA2_/TRDRNA2_188102_c0_seq1:113-1687(-)
MFLPRWLLALGLWLCAAASNEEICKADDSSAADDDAVALLQVQPAAHRLRPSSAISAGQGTGVELRTALQTQASSTFSELRSRLQKISLSRPIEVQAETEVKDLESMFSRFLRVGGMEDGATKLYLVFSILSTAPNITDGLASFKEAVKQSAALRPVVDIMEDQLRSRAARLRERGLDVGPGELTTAGFVTFREKVDGWLEQEQDRKPAAHVAFIQSDAQADAAFLPWTPGTIINNVVSGVIGGTSQGIAEGLVDAVVASAQLNVQRMYRLPRRLLTLAAKWRAAMASAQADLTKEQQTKMEMYMMMGYYTWFASRAAQQMKMQNEYNAMAAGQNVNYYSPAGLLPDPRFRQSVASGKPAPSSFNVDKSVQHLLSNSTQRGQSRGPRQHDRSQQHAYWQGPLQEAYWQGPLQEANWQGPLQEKEGHPTQAAQLAVQSEQILRPDANYYQQQSSIRPQQQQYSQLQGSAIQSGDLAGPYASYNQVHSSMQPQLPNDYWRQYFSYYPSAAGQMPNYYSTMPQMNWR